MIETTGHGYEIFEGKTIEKIQMFYEKEEEIWINEYAKVTFTDKTFMFIEAGTFHDRDNNDDVCGVHVVLSEKKEEV